SNDARMGSCRIAAPRRYFVDRETVPQVPRSAPVVSATLPGCREVRRSRSGGPMSAGERPSMAILAMDAVFSAGVLARLVASDRIFVAAVVLPADGPHGFPAVRVAGRRGIREL